MSVVKSKEMLALSMDSILLFHFLPAATGAKRSNKKENN
jgi:hypothetical protein